MSKTQRHHFPTIRVTNVDGQHVEGVHSLLTVHSVRKDGIVDGNGDVGGCADRRDVVFRRNHREGIVMEQRGEELAGILFSWTVGQTLEGQMVSLMKADYSDSYGS